jgi:hypothetical protein
VMDIVVWIFWRGGRGSRGFIRRVAARCQDVREEEVV